ncbi:MAG: hypothetical protein IKX74_06565 [Erysipelotrichaceae bacterium]|nr:hypothetical protein [Erysipelotrichaceae bacterium]
MSDELREYKCPNCGGILAFDSSTQNLKCPFCHSEFDVEMMKEYDQDLAETVDNDISWTAQPDGQWSQQEVQNIREYVCKSCGGDIITDETTAATSCPYCGNPVVMVNQFKGSLRPDKVIPFKFNKQQAIEQYRKHVSDKPLAPKSFKAEKHMQEIKGVYVPFWLYDADVNARARYVATRERHWSDRDYDYTETRYYNVFRDGSISFDNVPANGSTKMDTAMMESIEPFDMREAVDFNMNYLAGYFADKFDITAEESGRKANERIRNTTASAIESTVSGYSSVRSQGMNMRLLSERAKYCLLPVWLLVTTYQGQKYYFAMNGQTGKLIGDLPTDKSLYARSFASIFAIVSALVFVATYLLKLF